MVIIYPEYTIKAMPHNLRRSNSVTSDDTMIYSESTLCQHAEEK